MSVVSMLDRFRKSYDELKKLLPADLAVDLPSDRMAYSILKGIFQENYDFAVRCAHRTIEQKDIVDLAVGLDVDATNPLFDVLAKTDNFEAVVENLAYIAKGFGYK